MLVGMCTSDHFGGTARWNHRAGGLRRRRGLLIGPGWQSWPCDRELRRWFEAALGPVRLERVFGPLFAGLVGALSVTTEIRFGTIRPTLLV